MIVVPANDSGLGFLTGTRFRDRICRPPLVIELCGITVKVSSFLKEHGPISLSFHSPDSIRTIPTENQCEMTTLGPDLDKAERQERKRDDPIKIATWPA
jgi:hypothetical protein